MPRQPLVWSAWNYLTLPPSSKPLQTVFLTYNMNILQKLSRPTFGPILITLNPPHAPSQALT